MPKRSILALIPARKGSCGVRHKNIQKVGGTPLLSLAVQLAQKSQRKHEHWQILVSTDSEHYRRIARRAGATVYGLRPAILATSHAALIDVVLHALQEHESRGDTVDRLILLSATTPLTRPHDVRRALDLSLRHNRAVASVTQDPIPPSWRFRLTGTEEMGVMVATSNNPVGRRQLRTPAYIINGAIYIATPAWLRRYHRFIVSGQTLSYRMPEERSLDIESPQDLAWANYLWRSSIGY